MSSIDNRIVQMEFDNKQFEAGIQTTLKSLENLQNGLKLDGATDGIKNIEKAVSGFDMSGMAKAVDSIAQHFTWIGRTIDHELDRITSNAIAAGERMLKALSIEQVDVGWGKYEEKTRSVATIMSATGKSVDEVNTSLQKLNWFTDETSYNFTDMVNNVGKFTSVGVDLDDAVTAMQGIANAAALSGGGVNEASRAMYNFSQAMGTGKLLLQDWKSIELANMATTDFKNALIESGVAMGTLIKQNGKYISTTQDGTGKVASFTNANIGFRDSLSSGWITTEVMMDTFKKYGQYADEIYKISEKEGVTASEAMEKFSDSSMSLGERAFKAAQEARTFTDAINATKDAVSTGWMQSFEIIFGNYEQAKEMWTDLANTLWDVFAGGAEDRNKLLKDVFQNSKYIGNSLEEWYDSLNRPTGRELMIETVSNSFQALLKIIEPIKEAFKEIFPPMTAKRLYSIIERLRDFSANLIISNDSANKLKRGFKGVFSVVAIFADIVKLAMKNIKSLWDATKPFRDEALNLFAKLGDGLISFYEKFKSSGVFDAISNGLSRTFWNLSRKLLQVKYYISSALNASGILKPIKSKWNDLKKWITSQGGVAGIINTFFNLVNNWINGINISKIGKAIGKFVTDIRTRFKDFSGLKDFMEKSFNSIIDFFKNIGNISESKLGKNTNTISEWIKGFINGIKEAFSGISGKTGEAFKSAGEAIKNGLEWLGNAFTAGTNFLKDRLTPVIDFIRKILLLQTLYRINEFAKNINGVISSSKKVLDSVSTLIKNVGIGLKDLANAKAKNLKADAFLKIAESIGILVAAVYVLTKLNPDEVYNALTVIGVLFAELAGGLYAFNKALGEGDAKGTKKISGFLGLALGVFVLVETISKITRMPLDQVALGIVEVGAILLILSEFTKKTSSDFKASNGAALLLTALSLQLFLLAMLEIVRMKPANIVKGLVGLGALLTEVGIFTRLASKELKFSSGVGLLMIGISLQAFVLAMLEIAHMKPENAVKGLVGLGVLLTEVGIFTRMISKKIKFSNGVALLGVAASMLIFAKAIEDIGSIDTKTLVKGLAGMGVAMLEISSLTKSMSRMSISSGIGSLVGMASLIVLIPLFKELGKLPNVEKIGVGLGTAIAGIGVGMNALSKVGGIAGGFSAAGALLSFVATIGIIIVVVEAIAGLVAKIKGASEFLDGATEILTKVGESIGGFIGGITSGIMGGVGKGLESIGASLSIFWDNASGFINGVKGLKAEDFEGIGALSGAVFKLTASEFLDALTKLVGGGEKNLATFGEQLTALGPALSGFSDEAKKVSSEDVQNAADALSAIANIPIPASGGFLQTLIGEKDFANFGTQLVTLGPALSTFADNTAGKDYSGVEAAAKALGQLVSVDIPTVGGIVNAIVGRTDWAIFGSQLASFGPDFKTFADSVNGIKTEGLPDATKALAELLKVDAPKNEWGIVQIFTGTTNWKTFGEQLRDFGSGFKDFAKSMEGITAETLSGVTPAVDAMKKLLEMDIPKSDGFFQWLVGKKDLGDFGDNLKKIGEGFGTFNEKVGNINTEQLTGVVGLIERLGTFANNISGGIIDNIENFGTAMSTLDSNDFAMENAINALSGWSDDFADSGKSFAEMFVSALTDGISTKASSIALKVQDILKAIHAYYTLFIDEGKTLIADFEAGMASKTSAIRERASKIADSGITGFRNRYDSFYSSGQYLGLGFVYGIGSRASDVAAAARSLADVANYAFQSRLRIDSPSKVMEQNGEFFDMGFVGGVQNGSKNVENSVTDLADTAITSFTSAIDLINGVVNNTIDLQPTIRPVVDLSNVQSSAGNISSIFSQTQTIGLGGYQNPFIPNILSQISSNMMGQDQMLGYAQTDNSDIIDAIRDLGNEFETIKNAIAQMRVVMDGNALVGQIISRIDSQLGSISTFNERRRF